LDEVQSLLKDYKRLCNVKPKTITQDNSVHYVIFHSVSLAHEMLQKNLGFMSLPAPLVSEQKDVLSEEPRPAGRTTTRIAKRLISNALDLYRIICNVFFNVLI